MIKELFENGYLNIEKMIINEARNLDITPIETLTLIELLYCYKRNKKIEKQIIEINLKQGSKVIDNALNSLLEKNLYEIYISYDNSLGDEFIKLDPLFDKLEACVGMPQVIKQKNKIDDVINLLQAKMNRVLTANELDYVKDFVYEKNYDKDKLAKVIDDITASGKKITFRNIMVAVSNSNNKPEESITGLLSKMKG